MGHVHKAFEGDLNDTLNLRGFQDNFNFFRILKRNQIWKHVFCVNLGHVPECLENVQYLEIFNANR